MLYRYYVIDKIITLNVINELQTSEFSMIGSDVVSEAVVQVTVAEAR